MRTRQKVAVSVREAVLYGLDAGRQLRAPTPVSKVDLPGDEPRPGGRDRGVPASGYGRMSSAARELTQAIHDALEGHSCVRPLVSRDVERLLRDRGRGRRSRGVACG
jgi:hypothetical protein